MSGLGLSFASASSVAGAEDIDRKRKREKKEGRRRPRRRKSTSVTTMAISMAVTKVQAARLLRTERADIGMDWMSNAAHARKAPQADEEEAEKPPEKKGEDDVVVYKNELNPTINKEAPRFETTGARPVGTGDRGNSWKVKKLQRLKEQATEDNLDFNELVMSRFGNLDVIKELENVKAARPDAHRQAMRDRGGGSHFQRDRDGKGGGGKGGGGGRDEFGRDRDRDRRGGGGGRLISGIVAATSTACNPTKADVESHESPDRRREVRAQRPASATKHQRKHICG